MVEESQLVAKRHIAVLAFPFATHAAPLLGLVQRLSKAIPDAKFSFFSTAQSNRSIFRNKGDDDDENENDNIIKPFDVEDGLPEDWVFSHARPNEPVQAFLKIVPGNFRKAMEVAVAETGRRFTCLMSDAFFWFAGEMAMELQVPWVPLWTAGPLALLVHVESDIIRQKIINDKRSSTDFLPGMSGIRPVDMPESILRDFESPFSIMLYKMGLMLSQASAVATNSFEELDPVAVNVLKSKLNNYLNVGPFAITSEQPPPNDPHNCLEWLDKQSPASVVYISFGSVIQPPPQELATLAETLETTGYPFLWSFRGNPDEKLPKGFIERIGEKGKIVPWAPQLQILGHESVGVFLTHCGWNSVLESVIGGVPLICRPFFGDQPLNMRIVDAVWETGVGVDGGMLTKDETIKALELILCSEKGKKMREKLKAQKELAFNAVKSGGSSDENFETLVEVVSRTSTS
ncbi:putative Flavonoid 3-O-glucosyltransferase [Tripterygium wilfordii]|uniref:Glycosyltransferase n=1 Tax=Tripterygium wilfordii TaxID=458696 RepID=A0A7J7BWB6_TRIWF|nr:flavonoid 3-O-glucosyltransferase-like [Tripterygium wilfordii]KAF5725917.1 putative Flavonoid 3-O-glucosyltransferase [Tripterygium wilfordii]